jgi:hypothetical protein
MSRPNIGKPGESRSLFLPTVLAQPSELVQAVTSASCVGQLPDMHLGQQIIPSDVLCGSPLSLKGHAGGRHLKSGHDRFLFTVHLSNHSKVYSPSY